MQNFCAKLPSNFLSEFSNLLLMFDHSFYDKFIAIFIFPRTLGCSNFPSLDPSPGSVRERISSHYIRMYLLILPSCLNYCSALAFIREGTQYLGHLQTLTRKSK